MKKQQFIFFIFISGMQLLFSQQGKYCIENRFSETAMFDSSQIVVKNNVVYSIPPKWPGSGVDTLKLDIYYPDLAKDALSQRPCIVFFYGGAWLAGSKNDAGIKQKCFEWARRGFVAIAPNYRLGWNCSATDLLGVCVWCQGNYYDMPVAVYRGAQDGKAAMRWAVANAAGYGIDTGQLFTGGESAGSFNALHTAHWNHAYAKKVFNGNPYKILGSIDSAGCYPGLRFSVRGVIDHCGAVNSDTALRLNKIPMVAFHDAADCVVPYQSNQVLNCCATSFFWAKGSKILYDSLTKIGVPSELHTVQGATPQHCSYPSLTLVKESGCFIKKLLCGLTPGGSSNYPTTPAVSCNSLKALNVKTAVKNNLFISPNPALEYFTLSGAGQIEKQTLGLYNAAGKCLKTWLVIPGEKYDIRDFQPGFYFLEIKDQMGSHYSGVVVISSGSR